LEIISGEIKRYTEVSVKFQKCNAEMKKILIKLPALFLILTLCSQWAGAQGTMPAELTEGTLVEQVRYIGEKTRIYENYRAIREDMYRKLTGNLLDSVNLLKTGINDLTIKGESLQNTIDSLGSALQVNATELDQVTATRNSIRFFGMEVNKTVYNAITWTIILFLLALTGILAAVLKRNLTVTNEAKKEVTELREEFEAYRKSSREAREKMSMEHFKEIRRLRGG
jgi:hypothetical protein